MKNPKHELLIRWQQNCLRSQIANYDAANRFSRGNYFLGVPTIILTAIVGTSVFASLQDQAINSSERILVGILSVFAAVLAALQTFLKWGELATKFRAAAAEYGTIKREIDQLLVMSNDPEDVAITGIRNRIDSVSRDAPELPRKIWEKARLKVSTSDREFEN